MDSAILSSMSAFGSLPFGYGRWMVEAAFRHEMIRQMAIRLLGQDCDSKAWAESGVENASEVLRWVNIGVTDPAIVKKAIDGGLCIGHAERVVNVGVEVK